MSEHLCERCGKPTNSGFKCESCPSMTNTDRIDAGTKETALGNEILRGVVGSTAHGTAIGGQDDRDEMGVFIEAPEQVCGLSPCDHYIYRTAPEGVRSGPGDLDLTMYSLRKFCRLAAAGNPTVFLLVWLPEHITKTPIGEALIGMREAFVSKESGKRFLGYLTAQKMRLTGERAKTVARTDLVEKYGYDTKFAMHALRLGFQGIELLTDRRMTVPSPEPTLSTLRAVRGGEVGFTEAVRLIEDAEARLRDLIGRCEWKADLASIDRFMVKAHTEHWQTRFSSTVERRAVDAMTGVRLSQPGPAAPPPPAGGNTERHTDHERMMKGDLR